MKFPCIIAACLVASQVGWAQTASKALGPTDMSCESSFTVGYSNCNKPEPSTSATTGTLRPTPVAAPRPVKNESSGVTEAEIDAYIANHGKPSREAARALLDPTDENVAAMARRIRQDAAVASYVAGRMTTMQEIDPGLIAINPQFNSADLPMLAGMRVVLHVAMGCRACESAAHTLQRLVAESPVMDARVVVHGTSNAKTMTLELARLGITLPSTSAGPDSARYATAVPIAVIADTRNGTVGTFDRFENTQQLRMAIAAFRQKAIAAQTKK